MMGRWLLMVGAAVLAAGCAWGGGPEKAASLGKVSVVYRPSAGDQINPPATLQAFRSSTAAGPFVAVGPPARVARPAIQAGSVPVATDYGLPLGSQQYYYLQAVWTDGTTRKLGPVMPVVVAVPMEPGELRATKKQRRQTGR